ncbi:alpha/beta fold hydrolase [Candidatus Saccharibacteria bacterium]|nr:alpha/beta fold hydrolase [Candidatus Saccharibacteria bacterium]
MKRLLIAIIVLIVLSVGSAIGLIVLTSAPAKAPTPRPKVSASPTVAPPNPLSIAAVRAHPVVPSPVTVTQTLPSRGGCPTKVVSFRVDGLTEYALFQQPSTAAPSGGYPVIILAHGYIAPTTYKTDATDYQGFMNTFCSAGYAILKLDYRGNGSSAGSPTVGDLEAGYTYDLLGLTASLVNLSGVNANQVAWLGHSMGGAVVLRAAVASHNLPVKAIITASGVVGSVDDTLNNWPVAMLPADLIPQKAAFITAHGTPKSSPAFWHDISAINYVSAITAPVEINHGTADTVVPIAFSASLDSSLTAANIPHVYYTYAGGDHQYSQAGSGAAFLTNTLSFLKVNMK